MLFAPARAYSRPGPGDGVYEGVGKFPMLIIRAVNDLTAKDDVRSNRIHVSGCLGGVQHCPRCAEGLHSQLCAAAVSGHTASLPQQAWGVSIICWETAAL